MVGVRDSLRISLKAKGVAMRTFASFLLALDALFLLIPSTQAQTDRPAAQESKGGITGKVTDTAGAILQGAKVTLDLGGIYVVIDVQGQLLVSCLVTVPCT